MVALLTRLHPRLQRSPLLLQRELAELLHQRRLPQYRQQQQAVRLFQSPLLVQRNKEALGLLRCRHYFALRQQGNQGGDFALACLLGVLQSGLQGRTISSPKRDKLPKRSHPRSAGVVGGRDVVGNVERICWLGAERQLVQRRE
jgi:hypothetical protein